MPLCEECWEESETIGSDEPPPTPWFRLIQIFKEEKGYSQEQAESEVADENCSRCGEPLIR